MADERDWKHFADAGKRLASEENIKRSEKLWKKLVKELSSLHTGFVSIDSHDSTKKKLIISFDQDNAPVAYYFYNKETKKYWPLRRYSNLRSNGPGIQKD